MPSEPPEIPVSLLIVSDYEPGAKTWADERETLDVYLNDPQGIPAQVVVMEATGAEGAEPNVPEDIVALAPRVSVHGFPSEQSARLKDEGLAYCTHDLVAVIEADCVPQSGWLKALVETMNEDRDVQVASGRTEYGTSSMLLRVMSLLDRGFLECRNRDGRIIHACNNGAVYRREVLERFKYMDTPSPFVSGDRRVSRMRRAGILMEFDRRAVMTHAFGGWSFVWDVRRNKGFQWARLSGRRPGGGLLARLGAGFKAVWSGLCSDVGTAVRVGPTFLKWYDWPLVALLLVPLRVPEFLGGMATMEPNEQFAETTPYR